MGSRRGRLNWSNLEVHISDEVIEKQHRFTVSNSSSSITTSTENIIEDEREIRPASPPPPTSKRSWMPKMGVGEMQAEQFVGNFMLTNAEQTAIDKKYTKQGSVVERSKVLPVTNPIRISNRLLPTRDTPIPTCPTNLSIGQHLLNVFVCHVESYACLYVMFGDNYNRATELFQNMNTCDELIRPSSVVFEPKEKDLVALYHEQKWFRGRCLNTTDAGVNVLCIDSGVTIICSRNNLRRLPDSTIAMSSIPQAILSECFELLYKDRYEAIVTKLNSCNRPTIVLYYGDENVNDRLLAILKLI